MALFAVALGVVAPSSATAAATLAPGDADPVVFILDASGSMVREVSPGVSRMDVAKQALMETMKALPQGTQAGVLVFGTGTGNDDSQRAAGCADVKNLVPFGVLDPTSAAAAVAGVKQSGFTPIGPALTQAAKLLPATGRASIVLISDGVDTCAPPSSCEVAAELHRDRADLSIHVVAFGVDNDEAAKQQMSCIGGVGGGTSVAAADPTQLIARLKAVSNSAAAGTSLGLQGSHGVHLGMTTAEVRAQVDGAVVGASSTVGGVVVVFIDCPWGRVEMHDGRVYAVALADTSVGTADGIQPGSSPTQAAAIYGAPVASGSDTDGAYVVYRAVSGSPIGYRVTLSSDGANIRRIVLCRCAPIDKSVAASFWDIGAEGVGPLTLGMTSAAASAAVPSLRQQKGAPLTLTMNETSGGTFLTATFLGDRLTKVAIRTAYSDDPATDGPYLPGAGGIRIGDSMATAIAAFPQGSYDTVGLGQQSTYSVMDRTGRLTTFEASKSALNAPDIQAAIAAMVITSISIEDAAAGRTAAAFDELYPGRVSTTTPSQTADPAVPAELAGSWCTRDGTPALGGSTGDACFSFANEFAEYPAGKIISFDPPDANGIRHVSVCLILDSGSSCSTASSMVLAYFPVGVAWDCPELSGFAVCTPDFTAAHDAKAARLVVLYNHQQDTAYHDSPPLYGKR